MSNNPFSDDLTPDAAKRAYNNRELAQFHFYNPNGIAARWSELSNRLIANGKGYFAYGDTGYYHTELHRLAGLSQVRRFHLLAVLSGIERTITKGEAFLVQQEQAA